MKDIGTKKIVYWGAGQVGRKVLYERKDIIPVFLIDTNPSVDNIDGIPVKRPEEVVNWDAYFIIITVGVKLVDEVKLYLTKLGLSEEIDFDSYRKIFEIPSASCEENLLLAKKYSNEINKDLSTICINIPLFSGRQRKELRKFLSEYRNRYQNKYNIIVISTVIINSIFEAINELDVMILPEIQWNNCCFSVEDTDGKQILSDSDIAELVFRTERQDITYIENRVRSYAKYFDKLIDILNIQGILIWSGWTLRSYVTEEVAKRRGVEFRYLEHGWLPGTIQCDPKGIAGRSIYAKDASILNSIDISEEEILFVDKIKSNILEKQIDTYKFVNSTTDQIELNKIDSAKKTIFIVGFDENGIKINRRSSFWKENMSAVYENMSQILGDIFNQGAFEKYNVVFKPHPGNKVDNIEEYISKGLIYVTDTSIDKLIKLADVVVSVSSAVEYKALMYNKALVQAGVSSLSGSDTTYQVSSRRGLLATINEAAGNGMSEKQKNNFNYFLARLLKSVLWHDFSNKDLKYGLSLEKDFFDNEIWQNSI